jgi:medium-chain acyl-[acyl-carrier-protein] hydrolase
MFEGGAAGRGSAGLSASGEAVLRVYCFPWAGASAQHFWRWQRAMPVGVQVRPYELAGRGARLGEVPRRDLAATVRECAQALDRDPAGRCVFFGHSMGALIAFELTRALRAAGARGPAALIVSGAPAPHLPRDERRRSALPHDELLGALRDLAGTPDELLANAELMELLLPVIRADLHAVETHEYRPQPPLDVPIWAFGGLDDHDVPEESIEQWRHHTRAPFQARMLQGGHFFIQSREEAFLGLLVKALGSLSSRADEDAVRAG